MGCMPPKCFSNVKNQDVESNHNIEGRTLPQAMCPHTSKKWSKPFANSSGTKQSHKNSYTIPKGPLEKRRDE